MDKSPEFKLNSTDSSFLERQKNVFDQLKQLESSRTPSNVISMDYEDSPTKKSHRTYTKQFRGKESIFKKPQMPVSKNYMKNIPDFKKNPHKWTKYTLHDVKDEDISDRSNSKAALSFLNELKKRKHSEEESQKILELPNKIVFKKHTNINTKPRENTDEEKPMFRSSKVIMPEYVVGEKVKKQTKNKINKAMKTNELKLDHLLEEESDE